MFPRAFLSSKMSHSKLELVSSNYMYFTGIAGSIGGCEQMSLANNIQKLVLNYVERWTFRLLIFGLQFRKRSIGQLLASRKFAACVVDWI